MAENGTPSTTAAEPKKTRAKGVNKVGVEINAPKDVNPYLTAFRAKVGGENGDDGKPGRNYNDLGFTSLGFEGISDAGKINMIACLLDSMEHTSSLALACQIANDSGRRKIEADYIADYTDMAKRHQFTNLDKFAQAQTNGKTGKHFKSFNEMIEFAVEGAMNAAPAAEPVGADA
jgi:hypothetical protein